MNKTDQQIEQTTYPKENYYHECLDWARDFLLQQKEYYFNSDQLRTYHMMWCENIPREPRVWGSVIKALVKENIIIFASTQMIKPTSANHRRQTIWRTVK